MKKNNKTLILTTFFCLLPILLGLALYDRLPDQIAVHWKTARGSRTANFPGLTQCSDCPGCLWGSTCL